MKNQTLEVDTVSGATYSSRGILAAIEEALKEAERVTEERKIQPDANGNSDTDGNTNSDRNPGAN